MRRLVLFVGDWPAFATGESPDVPAAVLERGRVLACSPAARALGVHNGLRRREAESLAPGLRCHPRDPGREAREFEPIVRVLAELSTGVELTRPGLCALATRGPARYFGGEAALVDEVRSRVVPFVPEGALLGLGIADTPLAGMLAARAGCIVAAGTDAAFLSPYPVTVLGHSRLVEVLTELGVTTLGALAATSEGLVTARFGVEGAHAWALAAGRDETPLVPAAAPVELALTTELDPPADRVDEVAFATRAMTGEFVERCATRGLRCARFIVTFESEHGESCTRTWRAPRACTAEMIAERVRWQLEGWLAPGAGPSAPTGGVALVRIAADALVPAGGDQLDLLGVPASNGRDLGALDRLSALVGPGGLVRAELVGGRGPAGRVALVPWGDEPPPRLSGPWPGHQRLPSPAVVYDPARPCELLDGGGACLAIGGRGTMRRRPARLVLPGTPARPVIGFAGPWLYEEEWWTRRARRRARLQVLLGDESAHLCALEQGRWWLEASYD